MAKCALCGRPTTPFVFIGNEAIGPKCARRAGLTKSKAPKGSRIRFAAAQKTIPRAPVPKTMELFPELEEGGGESNG